MANCKTTGEEITRPCAKSDCKYFIYDRKINQSFNSRRLCSKVMNCCIVAADVNPDGITLQTIADMLDMSRERVRQIEDQALNRIKMGKIKNVSR